MTTTTTAPAAAAAPTTKARDWTRGHARAAGIAYLVTFAASIPAIPLLGPVLNDPTFILTGSATTQVAVGGLLDAVNAVACIATAVAVFPVMRRQNESLALGFVTSRVMEAAIIMIGVVSLLGVVTLRQDVAGTPGADPAALQATGQALVAVRDWTFNFGPNVCASINAMLFGTLLHRSRLVPRIIPTLGLVGAPLMLGASILAVLGVAELGSPWFIGVLPIAAWELSVGVYMTVKGFRPSPLTATAP
jgi:hypothetical protein